MKITGNIESIRAVEDCIRATKKYTEGISTIRQRHPIQGNGFASKVFRKHYEVSPDMERPNWDTPAGKAYDWLLTPGIHVRFYYDYRTNRAVMEIREKELARLEKAIPKIERAIRAVVPCANRQVGTVNNKPMPQAIRR